MSIKKIIVCNAHKEHIIVKVDGDKTNVTRECKGGGGGGGVTGIVDIHAQGNMEKEYKHRILSKEESFTIVGPGHRMHFSTSTETILLTIRLKNEHIVCNSMEVKKDDCYIINLNGYILKGQKKKKYNWLDIDYGINHKPDRPASEIDLGACRRTPDVCPVPELTRPVQKGDQSPKRHKVSMSEVKSIRDVDARCRTIEIGKGGNITVPEKTIMLVGATGTGKTTLVDGIVNYVLGVNWDDPFRYTTIDIEKEELAKQQNEAASRTEWITCYSIYPSKGSRLDYRLTIIDTPGFGHAGGVKRVDDIVEQIRKMFTSTDNTGRFACINALCFLVRAPDAWLTATERYTFDVIKSLFRDSIKKNICHLVTFADGEKPPVLASLTEYPFRRHFIFNNSALFAKNMDSESCHLSRLFWDMASTSFGLFFDHLKVLDFKWMKPHFRRGK